MERLGRNTRLEGGGYVDLKGNPSDRKDRKLKKIHILCQEFSEVLRKFPFHNKMDAAKAQSFLSGVRNVLQSYDAPVESTQPRRVPLWEGEEVEDVVDREQTKAFLEKARHRLRKEDG